MKRIQIEQEEFKFLLFTNEIIEYISNPKNSTRGIILLITTFSNVTGEIINQKNQYSYYIQMINRLEQRSEK